MKIIVHSFPSNIYAASHGKGHKNSCFFYLFLAGSCHAAEQIHWVQADSSRVLNLFSNMGDAWGFPASQLFRGKRSGCSVPLTFWSSAFFKSRTGAAVLQDPKTYPKRFWHSLKPVEKHRDHKVKIRALEARPKSAFKMGCSSWFLGPRSYLVRLHPKRVQSNASLLVPHKENSQSSRYLQWCNRLTIIQYNTIMFVIFCKPCFNLHCRVGLHIGEPCWTSEFAAVFRRVC